MLNCTVFGVRRRKCGACPPGERHWDECCRGEHGDAAPLRRSARQSATMCTGQWRRNLWRQPMAIPGEQRGQLYIRKPKQLLGQPLQSYCQTAMWWHPVAEALQIVREAGWI